MVELHVDDDGFVRAPRGLVYRCLTDIARWPTFWPGCDVASAPRPEGEQAEGFAVGLRARAASRRIDLSLRPHTWRHDEGFAFDLGGDVRGRGEFWLEEGWGGTVVHHLVHAEVAGRRPRALAVAYRAALRRGLCGLKDAAQSEVRLRMDLVP